MTISELISYLQTLLERKYPVSLDSISQQWSYSIVILRAHTVCSYGGALACLSLVALGDVLCPNWLGDVTCSPWLGYGSPSPSLLGYRVDVSYGGGCTVPFGWYGCMGYGSSVCAVPCGWYGWIGYGMSVNTEIQ
jgi:hypothetical protein